SKAVSLADQRRGMERLIAKFHPRRRLPAQIHSQAVTGLPVRQPLEGLQNHHRGHHPSRDGGPSSIGVCVQIGEIVVAEDPMALVGQQPVDRPLSEAIAQHLPRVLETLLSHHLTKSHRQELAIRAPRWWIPNNKTAITSATS